MKFLKIFLISVCMIGSAVIYSQPGWFKLNSGTSIHLNSVSFPENYAGLRVWAVGNNGLIIRSTNGGINWSSQASGTTNDLKCVIFRPDSTGYIVGKSGTILRSTNGGSSWIPVSSGTSTDLNAVWPFFAGGSVIAAGSNGTILKSTNSGASWYPVVSPVSTNLNCIISGFPNDVFIGGDGGKILYSGNLGDNWTEQPSGTTSKLNAFAVQNFWNITSVVHAVGDNGVMIKTTNSGTNWLSVTSTTTQNLYSVQTLSIAGDTLLYHIAVGANGTMIESIGGDMWYDRSHPFTDNFSSINMVNMNTGYAAGSGGTVIKSVGNYFYAGSKKLEANTISANFRNNGAFNSRGDSSLPGFEWPKGSGKFARYSSGLWIGAQVNGQTRVATSGSNNMHEYYPGYTDNNYIPHGRNDTNYRIYSLTYGSQVEDRQRWPNSLLGNHDQGAPVFYDTISGMWKPVDFGSQTMFYRYTDSYPESHADIFGGSTAPLKADIKQLNFSLDVPGALGNVTFTQFTIINRGNSTWNNAYFTIWSDDDVGGPDDDRVGCDSALKLGYTYNGDNNDPIYGLSPPAVGFVLLRGASMYTGLQSDTIRFCSNKSVSFTTGYKDMGMNVFNYSLNGVSGYNDPENYMETYNMMQGLHLDGSPIMHPAGYITKLAFSGNPVTGLGWISNIFNDHRMYISTGPVNVQPGDTQVVVIAQLIARSTNYIFSLGLLQSYVNDIKQFYNSCYTSTPIGISNNQTGIVKKFSLRQNYPNPFNPSTTIQYEIPRASRVSLKIYDVLGREIFNYNSYDNAGVHELKFDGSRFASGLYFYTIEAAYPEGIFKDTKKMLLIK